MKIVILGSGNGGVWTALHYAYYTRKNKNIEVELIHNPEIDSFPVGQATILSPPILLSRAYGTDWYHNEIRATPKFGILYENFSKKNIFHGFDFSSVGMQVDPKYLQRYILNSGLFSVKEKNITDLDTVDADVIFDCRGNIKANDIEYELLYSPVNSVLLAVGPSSSKPQLWSRHVATPDGWTFVIPNTTDTTSYGYLYNKDITPLETAKINFSELFPEALGSYSKHFDHKQEVVNFPFESYIAKEPVRIDSNGRKIILNGNRLAFLEPMESTAIEFYIDVAKFTFDWLIHGISKRDVNDNPISGVDGKEENVNNVIYNIKNRMDEIHTFISWHYTKGSVYDTIFWEKARECTESIFEQSNENFQEILDLAKTFDYANCRESSITYGHWAMYSIKLWYEEYIK